VAGFEEAISKIPQPPTVVLALVSLGGLGLCLLTGVLRWGASLLLLISLGLWPLAERPAILLSESGALIGVMTPEGRAFNKERGDGFSARIWLENDGDGADQESAASREEIGRDRAVLSLGSRTILYDRNKKLTASDVQELCQRYDLVLLPRWEGEIPCQGVSSNDLRKKGALAIHTNEKDQPRLVFSRDVAGERLWNTRKRVPN